MKIAVISDTHGEQWTIDKAVFKTKDLEIDAWIHLGDGYNEVQLIREKTGKEVFAVRGNCDFAPNLPSELVLEFEGIKLLALHGHTCGVKYDRTKLFYKMEELGCDIALYGHSHVSLVEASGRLLCINPGSAAYPKMGREASIAILEINGKNVYPTIITI